MTLWNLKLAGGAACVAACAAWGLWPIEPRAMDVPMIKPVESGAAHVQLTALDLDAFRAPVWVAAPPPPPDLAPAADPPPLRLQLLAISRDGDAYRAFLYDPDADRLFVVGDGQVVGTRAVERVTPDTVVLRDGSGEWTLALREDRGEGHRP